MTPEVQKSGSADPGWVIDQLTILAEAFGTPMTAARLKIYTANLADLTRDALAQAVARALRECKFFPAVAELRELASAKRSDLEAIKAEADWQQAVNWVRHCWHPDLGRNRNAPELPARIEYALRSIGGPYRVFMRTIENEAFLRRDFIAALRLAPTAEQCGLLTDGEAKRAFARIALTARKAEGKTGPGVGRT